MPDTIKELNTTYFSLDKSDIYYNEDFSVMKVYIDLTTHEVVTELISRWNSSYNECHRVKF